MKSENDDGDDAASPSRYSSCGDSEFERYCSANSAMGTPSVCSSIAVLSDFPELEIGGSSRNLGLGLESLRLSDDSKTSVNYGSTGFELYGDEGDEIGLSAIDSGLMSWKKTAESESLPLKGESKLLDNSDCSEEDYDDHGDRDDHDDRVLDCGVENSGPPNDDVASSRDEHSEDEDSMYGSDSQDKRVDHRYTARSVDAKTEDINPLLINSSVAFGSDDWDDFVHQSGEFAVPLDIPVLGLVDKSEYPNGFLDLEVTPNLQEEEDVKDIPVASCQVQSGNEVIEFTKSSFTTPVNEEDVCQISFTKNEEDVSQISFTKNHVLRGYQPKMGFSEETFDNTDQASSCSAVSSRSTKLTSFEDSEPSTLKNHSVSDNRETEHPKPVKTESLELNESYDEFVLEMEEILLASNESPGGGSRFSRSHRSPPHPQPARDGGPSASTSGAASDSDDTYPFLLRQPPPRISRAEVVGAQQRLGDVSLGERLVGVREHTTYRIRVTGRITGEEEQQQQWEVERRYRDFSTLHRRLKSLSAAQAKPLPPPWAEAERESLKIFGNSVSSRSDLIQRCLDSILDQPSLFGSQIPSPLVWFLCPHDSSLAPSSTVSLIVEVQNRKSVKRILEEQRQACAGCRRHFDEGKTVIRDFAMASFGWGRPRVCEYTGQAFCSSCHVNETAVLPARVLHEWDFTRYPVSQLAKSYLDSIHEQPMLCVSAVNPFLFSKVPTLSHVMGVRRKIGSILAYVRCSFRGSINRGLGSRRYLLQANDFFALRDLIDLSKGAFAVLPGMIEEVLKAIVEHITEQCLVCCDVGVPCGARQACHDPSSLIFPFQEGNIEKCRLCKSEFHKTCFEKLSDCHCGAHLRLGNNMRLAKNRLSRGESSGALEFLGSGLGFRSLSGLFAKANSESVGELNIDSDNVILMGSLPSTNL